MFKSIGRDGFLDLLVIVWRGAWRVYVSIVYGVELCLSGDITPSMYWVERFRNF